MVTTVKKTNGVDIKRLHQTIKVIRENPELANFRFRAVNEWIDCGHNRTTIRDFYGAGQEDTSRTKSFILDNDEPDVLLGQDNGANPVEYLLHGLAGCITTTLVYHAAAKGMAIDSVSSTLEGDLDLHGFLGLDQNVRPGYQQIRVTFRITGNLTQAEKEELVALGQRFSPVCDTLRNGTKIDVQVVA